MNLPLCANVSRELEMGGGAEDTTLCRGPLIGSSLVDPGVYSSKKCAGPRTGPHQLLANAKWRVKPRMAAITSPYEDTLHEGEIEQMVGGVVGWPLSFWSGWTIDRRSGPADS